MSTSNFSDEREVTVVARTLEMRSLGFENSQCPAIETLSDDVLLEIFDIYLVNDEDIDPWYYQGDDEVLDESRWYDAWFVLVHVCQRWRYAVFASPGHLNLRLHCSRRRVRETLGVWPALPIIIWDLVNFTSDDDNIIAALEHRDRVCEIKLGRLTRLQLDKLLPLMQESFPALTKFQIGPSVPLKNLILPDSFLGGSSPHLRFLCLPSISFPALPNLLLSAINLVHLYLDGFPYGYISPDIVAALSDLTKLELLHLSFRHPYPDSDSSLHPPPMKRSVLPALKSLELTGDDEYFDDFAARVDVPSVKHLKIMFSTRPFIVDNFPHLPQLIGCVEEFRSFDYVGFGLSPHAMDVTVGMRRWTSGAGNLELEFFCDTDGPLPSLVDACNASLIPLSNIETFEISSRSSYRYSPAGFSTGDPKWLELLRQFYPAKKLYVGSTEFIPPVAFALKRAIEEGMTDVLPAIQELSIFRSPSAGPDQESIEQFATARGLHFREGSRWRSNPQDTHEWAL